MKISIIIPAYNEENTIADTVMKVKKYMGTFNHEYEIIIAENNSTDSTFDKAHSLAKQYRNIKVSVTKGEGRGRALNKAIKESDADIIGYMDADLSTDISILPEFFKAIKKGHSIAIASRHLPDSSLNRGFKRNLLSKGYNFILQKALNIGVKDAQCGFKFFHSNAAKKLIKHVKDEKWFWDTEMIYHAKTRGHKIKEIPVVWKEDKDSKVKLFSTCTEYLANIYRLRKYAKK
jgi:glycosyltransferase involved in cell wall biosynthesis